MRIRLTKLDDQRHELEVLREDGSREQAELETRSCLFHDLTHLALEEAAGFDQGFWGSLAGGRTLAELGGRAGEPEPEYTGVRLQIERAVVMLQGMARSGEDPAAVHARITDLLAAQGQSPPPWLTIGLVEEVHER